MYSKSTDGELKPWISEFINSGCFMAAGASGGLWVGWGDPVPSEQESARSLSVYAPDFFLEDPKPWFLYPHWREISRGELIETLQKLTHDQFPQEATGPQAWEPASAELFEGQIQDIQSRIQSGELRKAVPVVFQKATHAATPAFRAWTLLRVLEKTRDIPVYPYGFWYSGDSGSEGMIGATPELLFDYSDSDHLLTTMALAGTRPHLSDQVPLMDDPKERLEHQCVIDGIAESLSDWGEIQIGETRELKLPTLSHLLTPVRAKLSGSRSLEDLARALHPTPALGAWPKKAGWTWLKSNRGQINRRRFGAPFGMTLANDLSRCVVSIRNIQWRNQSGSTQDELLLGTGCGIIAESRFDREWRELEAKRVSLKRMLGI